MNQGQHRDLFNERWGRTNIFKSTFLNEYYSQLESFTNILNDLNLNDSKKNNIPCSPQPELKDI